MNVIRIVHHMPQGSLAPKTWYLDIHVQKKFLGIMTLDFSFFFESRAPCQSDICRSWSCVFCAFFAVKTFVKKQQKLAGRDTNCFPYATVESYFFHFIFVKTNTGNAFGYDDTLGFHFLEFFPFLGGRWCGFKRNPNVIYLLKKENV